MTAQARKTILAALQSLIVTNVTDLKYVSYKTQYNEFSEIPHQQRPACIIESGNRESDHKLTLSDDYLLFVAIYVVADPKTSDDDVYDLDEAILDVIAGNPTLSDTCIMAYTADADPPRLWPRDSMKVLEQRIRITYRRDIP